VLVVHWFLMWPFPVFACASSVVLVEIQRVSVPWAVVSVDVDDAPLLIRWGLFWPGPIHLRNCCVNCFRGEDMYSGGGGGGGDGGGGGSGGGGGGNGAG
jgi:uncharacterized membrane protein YgcG